VQCYSCNLQSSFCLWQPNLLTLKNKNNFTKNNLLGVNITNQNANVPVPGVWFNQFQQQNCTQLYLKTQLECMPNFNTLCSMPYANALI